jgi:hypothetical protein
LRALEHQLLAPHQGQGLLPGARRPPLALQKALVHRARGGLVQLLRFEGLVTVGQPERVYFDIFM